MTFEEYQRLAARTARYDARVWNTYLVPALIGEVGELVEVFAKHVRDCDPGGTYMEFSLQWPDWAPGGRVYRKTFRRLMRVSAMLDDWHDTHPHVGFMNLIGVLQGLGAVAQMCGTTLEQLGEANIDKLASRAERGVLKGDGDGR